MHKYVPLVCIGGASWPYEIVVTCAGHSSWLEGLTVVHEVLGRISGVSLVCWRANGPNGAADIDW